MTKPWDFLVKYKPEFFEGKWPTLPEMFRISCERFPDRPCFTIYKPERQSMTYAQAKEKIERLANYLASNGYKKGDKIALAGKNSPEWAIAYLAILFAGLVVVPIDYQLGNEEIKNIIKASDSRALFIDEEKYDQLNDPSLKLEGIWSLSPKKPQYIMELQARDNIPEIVPAKEDDLAAILYTSGTTGHPKGVMLSHSNFVSDCYLAQANLSIYHTDVFYALLPIHHSYTMLAVFIEALSVGAELVFGQRMVTSSILHDLKEAKITMFLGVPMLFNKVLAGILKGIKAKGPFVSGIMSVLMAYSGFVKKVFKVNPGKRLFGAVLDKASLRTIRICISGGGPLAPRVFRKYNQLGIDFVQGYGLTETSPILTLNPTEAYKETSVGKILPGVQMRILEADSEGRGEIAVKGPMVMQGYYKDEESTQEVFTEDGWFKTGDVGYMDWDNYLYLTGRAKNLIVTDGGKNVYPEEIEDSFQLYAEIEQIMVRGYMESRKENSEGIEALVYPNQEWFENLGESIDKDKTRAHIQKIIDEVNTRLLPYQRISRLTVLEEPLEMTSTKKVKRFAVKEQLAQ